MNDYRIVQHHVLLEENNHLVKNIAHDVQIVVSEEDLLCETKLNLG